MKVNILMLMWLLLASSYANADKESSSIEFKARYDKSRSIFINMRDDCSKFVSNKVGPYYKECWQTKCRNDVKL